MEQVADPELEQRCVDVIRGLAMDAPQQANSGHPGTAMALAPLAHVLWTRIMRHDADAPDWPNRDRFVLSCGHASILLYSMLYLTGYGLELDDLRDFRQWGSKTPGHPERGHTTGVEVTTGPLGQGVANGIGMALAEHHLRARFGPELFDHRTFVLASDGDLMEGISHEAASLAGHLGLDKLVVVYDDNHITIDGPTELALTDDAAARFASYGWHVVRLGEVANDLDALEAAIRGGISTDGKPTLLVLRSHIGWPSPNLTDTSKAHGSPFGAEEIAATKAVMGLPPDEAFFVPDDVLAFYRAAGRAGAAERDAWEQLWSGWSTHRAEIEACLAGTGLDGWQDALPTWEPGTSIATRKASDACLNAIIDQVPGLIGGGADLTPYYLYEEDAVHFHSVMKEVCDSVDESYYSKFKPWCDEYFFLKHRGEARGIGGLFFDYLGKDDPENIENYFSLASSLGGRFCDAYLPIVSRRKAEQFSEQQKHFQLIRRGRYVEFNLIWDRGTLFGLRTNGRAESILMSLPAEVRWEYDFEIDPGSREAELIEVLTSPREWI